MITRYVMKRAFPFFLKREIAVVEVADDGAHHLGNGHYQLHKPWRKATAADLEILEQEKEASFRRKHHDRKLPVGTRVKVKSGAFDGNAVGTVVFQEPSGGKVWVVRDGTESPCYYWNNELIIIGE